MRLLNTSTLAVEEFHGSDIPEYAILSHTWEHEEVTLQDLRSGKATSMHGYAKLTKCCEQAARDGYTYCWIDTCCIDKTSSAELSEAINSMYAWYRNSHICYAYLTDCEGETAAFVEGYRGFLESRWWTRGWTLQELIAPKSVEFYDADWTLVGTKVSLQEDITALTGIDEDVLRHADPLSHNVAVRMSWAASRQTTRIEDRAYCLMGLFGVNMPLLYGEGNRAFIRLQEEIMRVTEDYTLFIWFRGNSSIPDSTSRYGKIPHFGGYDPPTLTSRGLRITLPLCNIGATARASFSSARRP
ncbi:heterokaryon incompatibility protein-domain-containing protein [Lophiotrema nucula]|uniref:Heterokaryon incompatibility protein-domain-containing protein n=1 Tax=Lophiotrema nucula TaxID=690887 RepID=A0A6A5ZDU2_9PLEO|nr:heterokaryon incompatibility protein-domain-containing protein [Lophiotrema nucula]